MLSAVSLGLAGIVAFVILRWLAVPPDALGRKRSFPRISVALAGSLSIMTGAPVAIGRGLTPDERLSAIASAMAGRAVEVHCHTGSEEALDTGAELGYVMFRPDGTPTDRAVIKRPQCLALAAYLAADVRDYPKRAATVAVHVLTHESMHLAGIRDEAEAECAAMQRDSHTAVMLGATARDARTLAELYWKRVYPNMPAEYRSDQCRPGGAMDEALPGAPWGPAP